MEDFYIKAEPCPDCNGKGGAYEVTTSYERSTWESCYGCGGEKTKIAYDRRAAFDKGYNAAMDSILQFAQKAKVRR